MIYTATPNSYSSVIFLRLALEAGSPILNFLLPPNSMLSEANPVELVLSLFRKQGKCEFEQWAAENGGG